jgi:gluconate 2-dehydrogenase gamma chain
VEINNAGNSAPSNTTGKTVSRRDLFQIAGTAAAAAGVAAGQTADQTHAAHAPAAAAPVAQGATKAPYQRKVFDEHQWRAVHVLCDLLIPADERSGSATQAGVPEFIDDWLDFRRHEDGTDAPVAQIQGGLAWLDQESNRLSGKDFAVAAPDQQKQILDRIAWPARAAAGDARWVRFFNRFRDLTVSGFFSSKMGVTDLPYLGNRPVAQWKGCDPAVWAKIAERMTNGYKGLGGEVKPWSD